ncbi:uncharacterized protein LOC8288485 isoform X8 [Ricinus communis]|uniref:uncharacterized protein LOC8288485 isoform X8 n=1 Tax=Ricinus communis TaxID=3988 RepID=UPI00201A9F85|nr:uncharacterized protein LOC8288485 isoform X8 [Ricinus communis]
MNLTFELRLEPSTTGIISPGKLKEADYAIRRRKSLQRVDRELSKGNFKDALSLVNQLQGKPFGLRGFGAAKQHEAGHFLVGYLLGSLPKRYRTPSIEKLRDGNFAGGNVKFLGFEFLREVGVAQMLRKDIVKEEACYRGSCIMQGNRGKISSKTLNNFSCITLGGLVVEHLAFGHSEGHYSDVVKEQLDSTLKWLELSEDEANFQVRWAAVNTIAILNRHYKARLKLVEAMARGQSVGCCIDAIENGIDRIAI